MTRETNQNERHVYVDLDRFVFEPSYLDLFPFPGNANVKRTRYFPRNYWTMHGQDFYLLKISMIFLHFRIQDMTGDVSNSILQNVDNNSIRDPFYHRRLKSSCSNNYFVKTMERQSCDEHITNDLPLMPIGTTSITSIASKCFDIEADNEQSIYSDGFLERCMELASYNHPVCDREIITWFRQVRRRCSNIRSKFIFI